MLRLAAIMIIASAMLFSGPGSTLADVLEPAKDHPIQVHDDESGYKTNFLTLPIVAYTPEATFMLGLNFLLVWDKEEPRQQPQLQQQDDKTNVVNLVFIYTLLDQVICALSIVNNIPDVMMIKSGVYYQRFPSRFYGIGPDTPESTVEKFTPEDLKYRLSGLFNPVTNLFFGPRYEFGFFRIEGAENSDLFRSGSIGGKNGTIVSGFGVEILWDSLDNFFYPYKGSMIQLIVIGYHEYMGSSRDFYRVEFDSRVFFNIIGKHVLALQYYMILTGGDVPYQLMGKLGGMNTMRGYYEGRYVDQNYYTLQGEYRFPLIWRFSGVVFCGIGIVSPKVREIDFNFLRVAWGAGFRLALNRERMINLRLDLAVNDFNFGREDYGVYFSVTEAF